MGWLYPDKRDFENLIQVPSGKKAVNFGDMHRIIMGFKGWLRGIHHKFEYLQAYIDEYCNRYNRNTMGEGIFDKLLKKDYVKTNYLKQLIT